MGEVFLAWDERLRRHVAIKRIRSDKPMEDAHRRRFRREARAVARLSHPAIVQIFDIVEDEGEDCIVMEHVAGQNLRELLAEGPLDPRRALDLAREIAEGLSEAHRKGLVHRDLKPENIRVTRNGNAKILDFGLAQALWRDDVRATEHSPLTAEGALVGTAYAMSPEQASGRSVDHRADLFALGSLLYEMLSGRSPFLGDNLLDTLRRINSEEPTPLAEICPDLPAPICSLIAALLAKDPRQRPANAQFVARQLAELSGQAPSDHAVAGTKTEDTRTADARQGGGAAETADALADRSTTTGIPIEPDGGPVESALRVLVLTDLVGSTDLVETLGDAAAARLWARHDRLARDLLTRYDGLEIDKSDGFLFLFERPGDAVSCALAYHQALERLSQVEISGTGAPAELTARVGIHLGEVFLRRNAESDVARGAKPLEVEGLAKPTAARLMSLAGARQTLLTRGVFDLARRAAAVGDLADPELRWLAHGQYSLKGISEPLEICEVGLRGSAPLSEPADSEKARRTVAFSDEPVLGWRPAVGQEILHRPRWTLEERLGEGGFGEVWLARHTSGESRVFKFCFESERLRALQREVTLLRLLKDALGHRDDIARVLDWNFDSAPFFLETEYTEGGSLSTWATDQGGLAVVPLAIRLELAAQVADALAAAHSVGVLHQDVKPGNVLIVPGAPAAGSASPPRALLSDFGIARLSDQDVLEDRDFTALGFTEDGIGSSSGAGTRLYMAPEVLAGGPASIQADLYSLGVLVFQLAIGDLQQALAPGWRRMVPDPLLAEDLATLVDLAPEMRPASATVVAERLRGLEIRREQRAERERLETLRRQQEHEVEEARRALARSRRRRRILSATVAAGALLLLVIASLALRAERARSKAETARGDAEELIDFMLHDLPRKLRPVGRLDVLGATADKALDYFASLDPGEMNEEQLSGRAQALRQIGNVRLSANELEAAQGAFSQSLALLDALIARYRVAGTRTEGSNGPGPEELALLADRADTEYWLGYVRWKDQDPVGALEAYETHRQAYADLLLHDPENRNWRLELAYGHMNVGDALVSLGRATEALEHQLRSLDLMEELSGAEPARLDLLVEVGQAQLRVGSAMLRNGEADGATRHFRHNLEINEGLARRDGENAERRYDLAMAYSAMAWGLGWNGNWQEEIQAYSSAVAILQELTEHDAANAKWQQQLARVHQNLGRTFQSDGDHQASLRHYEAAMAIASSWLERDPTSLSWQRLRSTCHHYLSWQALRVEDLDRAQREARSCIRIFESLEPEREQIAGVFLSRCHSHLAEALERGGDPVGARIARVRAVETIEPLARDSHNSQMLERWVLALLDLGQRDEALEILEQIGPRSRTFRVALAEHGLES